MDARCPRLLSSSLNCCLLAASFAVADLLLADHCLAACSLLVLFAGRLLTFNKFNGNATIPDGQATYQVCNPCTDVLLLSCQPAAFYAL
jgi:hypothetical protein